MGHRTIEKTELMQIQHLEGRQPILAECVSKLASALSRPPHSRWLATSGWKRLHCDRRVHSLRPTLHLSCSQVGCGTNALLQASCTCGPSVPSSPGGNGAGRDSWVKPAAWIGIYPRTRPWSFQDGSRLVQSAFLQLVVGVCVVHVFLCNKLL